MEELRDKDKKNNMIYVKNRLRQRGIEANFKSSQ